MKKLISSLTLLGSLVSFSSLAAFTEEVRFTSLQGTSFETKESAFAQGHVMMDELSGMDSKQLRSEFKVRQIDSMIRDLKLLEVNTQVIESMDAEGDITFVPVVKVKYSYVHNDK